MPTNLSAFYTDIKLQVPNAPNPLIDQALRSAADEFCTRSGIVQEIVQANAQVGVAAISFTAPSADLEIRRYLRVWYGETELFSAGPTLVDTPTAYLTPVSGTPVRHLDVRASSVRVFPAPSVAASNAFTAVAVVAPVATANTLPDVLFREWRLAIAAGARAYIKSISGQPFTGDPTNDMAFFRTKMSDALAIATMGNARGELVMRAPAPIGVFRNR